MHVFNYNRINNFLNRIFDWWYRPRVGDWYLPYGAENYSPLYGENVYVVEEVGKDFVVVRFCGVDDGYRAIYPNTIPLSRFNDQYERVTRQTIEQKLGVKSEQIKVL